MNSDPSVLFDFGAVWLVSIVSFLQHSFLFAAIKWFLFLYVVVLLVNIILLLSFRGIYDDLRNTLHGSNRPLISKSHMIVR